MLAYRQTIDKNYSSINSNHKSFMTRKKYNVLGSCYQEEFKVNNNSYTIDYEYDMLRPSKQIIDLCDETQIYDSIEYSYDVMGNITSQIFKLQDETVKSKTLQYDELNNLIYQTDNEGNSITYFYDDFGNIDKKEIIQNGIEITYVYNYDQSIHDKLLSISNYETEEVIYELKYEGVSQYLPTKLIKNGTENILIWNNGLLTRFNNITFEYDQTGNRLKKTIGTTSTNYYYDGNKLIYEVKEINGVKQTPQEYIYNNDGQVIAIKYNNNYYFYVRDLLGNIIGLLDTNYKFVVEYHYSDYGEILEINGSKASTLGIDNPFKYKGYYYDVETNLFLVTSRYYSPELCRFIQPADVSTLNPSSINGLNLYSYANNNPISIAYSSSGGSGTASSGMLSSIGSSVGGGSMNGSGVDGSTSIPRNMTPVPRWIKTASSIADPLTSFVGPIRTSIYAFTTTDLWDLMRLDGVDELPGILSKSMKIAGYGLAIFNAGIAGYEKYASGASNISAFAGALINACIGIGSIHVSTLVGSFAVGLLSATALSGGWIVLLSAGAAFIAGTAVNHLLTKLEIGGNTIEGHLNNLVDWLIWWD